MFTVILLPCVTLGLALWFQPLFAAVLLPVLPDRQRNLPFGCRQSRTGAWECATAPGWGDEIPGAGKRLRPEGHPDFGFGPRRMEQVREKNRGEINRAAHGMTLHRQAVSSPLRPFLFTLPGFW